MVDLLMDRQPKDQDIIKRLPGQIVHEDASISV